MTIHGNSKTMMTIITTLTSTSFLKSFFLTMFGINFVAVLEQASDIGIYEALLNNTPAQVLSVLGIIAGIIYVLRLADNAWANHKKNVSIHKMDIEKVEQEEIETEKRRKELENDSNN